MDAIYLFCICQSSYSGAGGDKAGSEAVAGKYGGGMDLVSGSAGICVCGCLDLSEDLFR